MIAWVVVDIVPDQTGSAEDVELPGVGDRDLDAVWASQSVPLG